MVQINNDLNQLSQTIEDKNNQLTKAKSDLADAQNQLKDAKSSQSDLPYLLCPSNLFSLTYDNAIFTDNEFNDLIKYIKTLPDGKWQAKMAEHGKTETKNKEDN